MYFSIHTKKESITWKTEKIEKCIDKTKMFLKEVKSWDSWNNKDYNCQETNYISIITSEDKNGKIPKQSIEIIKKLSELLSEKVLLED